MALPNPFGSKIEMHGAADLNAILEQNAWVEAYKAQQELDSQYTLLTSSTAPEDWATDWTDYYKKVNNQYIQLDDVSAPVYKANTYYSKNSN